MLDVHLLLFPLRPLFLFLSFKIRCWTFDVGRSSFALSPPTSVSFFSFKIRCWTFDVGRSSFALSPPPLPSE